MVGHPFVCRFEQYTLKEEKQQKKSKYKNYVAVFSMEADIFWGVFYIHVNYIHVNSTYYILFFQWVGKNLIDFQQIVRLISLLTYHNVTFQT